MAHSFTNRRLLPCVQFSIAMSNDAYFQNDEHDNIGQHIDKQTANKHDKNSCTCVHLDSC